MKPANIWSAVFLVFALLAAESASAVERPIDTDKSIIRIHVRKSGLFSAAGHEHWVAAPIAQGSIDERESSHIAFTFDARKLTVEPDNALSAEKQAEVQQTMQEKVLESERYPEISFRSTSVTKTGTDTWTVRGVLKLHGHTNPVSATVRKDQDRYVGSCRIKQADFGIQPVSAGGGLVKVKNEIEVEFTVMAARSALD
jgi:polyisoprenoid-binding protein YceI